MQIDLFSLLGFAPHQASTAPTMSGAEGEFAALFGQLIDPPESPPGVAAPPFLLEPVSATGNEEVSLIQPNADGTKLDFFPQPPVNPENADVEREVEPRPELALPAQTAAAVQVPDGLLAATIVQNDLPAPTFVESSPVPRRVSFHQREVPALVSPNVAQSLKLAPEQIPIDPLKAAEPVQVFTVSNPPHFSGDLETSQSPTVWISGLAKQFSASPKLDPVVVAELNVTEVSGVSAQKPHAKPAEPGFASAAVTTQLAHVEEPTQAAPSSTPLKLTAEQKQLEIEPAPTKNVPQELTTVARPVSNPIPLPVLQVQTQTGLAPHVESKPSPRPQPSGPALKSEVSPVAGATAFSIEPNKQVAKSVEVSPPLLAPEPTEDSTPLKESPVVVETGIQSSSVALEPKRIVERTEPKLPLSQVAQREVIQQAVDNIEAMALNRPVTQIVVQLNPQDLGEITLKIKSLGAKTEADISATDERVIHALETHRPQLIQAIENKGLNLSSLNMQFGGQKGDQAPAQQQDFARAMNTFQNTDSSSSESTTHSTYLDPSQQLNLVI